MDILFVATDRATRRVFVQIFNAKRVDSARTFLKAIHGQSDIKN